MGRLPAGQRHAPAARQEHPRASSGPHQLPHADEPLLQPGGTPAARERHVPAADVDRRRRRVRPLPAAGVVPARLRRRDGRTARAPLDVRRQADVPVDRSRADGAQVRRRQVARPDSGDRTRGDVARHRRRSRSDRLLPEPLVRTDRRRHRRHEPRDQGLEPGAARTDVGRHLRRTCRSRLRENTQRRDLRHRRQHHRCNGAGEDHARWDRR